MPQDVKTDPTPPPQKEPSLHGLIAESDDPAGLADALEKAFDYRGDVTIVRTDGETITGYLFDRRAPAIAPGSTPNPADMTLRIMTAASDTPVIVRLGDVERIEFTGKDAAHGKSFERWVQKYIEKKRKGEEASIESEALE